MAKKKTSKKKRSYSKMKGGIRLVGNTYVGVVNVAGKRYERSMKTNIREVAIARRKELEVRLLREAGLLDDSKAEGIEKVRDYLLEQGMKSLRRSEMTVSEMRKQHHLHTENQKSHYDNVKRWDVLEKLLGPTELVVDITTADLRALREELMKRKTRTGKPISRSTVNRYMALLRGAFTHAISRLGEEIPTNPAAAIEKLPENGARHRPVSFGEFKKILRRASADQSLFFRISYLTGMRRGEVVEMTWDRVLLRRRIFRLTEADTKTGEPRRVPIPKSMVKELKQLRLESGGKGRVFLYTHDHYTKNFAKYAKELDIENVRLHDLRHSATKNFNELGSSSDQYTTSRILGHKDVNMTLRYHTTDDEHVVKVMDEVEDALNQWPDDTFSEATPT